MDSESPNYELETDDTLSLCEFSIYTDSTSDTQVTEQGSLNSSFADEEFFEFFTDKGIPCFQPPETVLFCGTIIARPNQSLVMRYSLNSDPNDCKRRKGVLSSPKWSRWQMFVFGLAKLPKEVDVGDSPRSSIRKNPPAVIKRRKKSLWGLVRDLSCGRHRLQPA